MSNWLFGLFMLLPFFGVSQNTAPVAVNDTFKVCNDVIRVLVTGNDTDVNNDKLRLSYVSQPTPANGVFLFSETNTGYVQLMNQQSATGTYTFNYKVRDLKFANIGSLESNIATVVLTTTAPYTYSGTYSGTNTRTACRSTTSGTVNITGHETMEVYTYGEFLPGTTIDASGGGVYEIKPKQ